MILLAILVLLSLTAYCYFLSFSMALPLLLLAFGIQLYFYKQASLSLFLQLGLLLTLLIGGGYFLYDSFQISKFYIPVSSVAMLTVLLFKDLQIAFLISLISSCSTSLVIGEDLNYMLIFFMGSLTGVYSIQEARTRSQLINAGFYVGGIQVLCSMLIYPHAEFLLSKDFLFHYLRPLFFNGFISAGVVIVFCKIFESWFRVLTNFSLLELSDFNQPLLKRMVLEAPGTYHHSLVVSNLAEAAAEAIGADGLLARVGAYYHDIGKMVKAEYYTENQLMGANVHDKIEPSISRLVILNHVKEGIELAKKHKLNPRIIDFIPQHHGTSLMHYFYQKALEEGENVEKVDEANFRYPGPKPQTKETAIVLLADSVEGAVRALDDPIPKRIEEVVRKVINNKFIDGQLDACNLTLKEIDLISTTFIRILSAMYHSRVKYPEKKSENGHNAHKSAEKASSPASQNPSPHSKDPSA